MYHMVIILLSLIVISCTPSVKPNKTISNKKNKQKKISDPTIIDNTKGAYKTYHKSEARLKAARILIDLEYLDEARFQLKKIISSKKSSRRTHARALFLLMKLSGKSDKTILLEILTKYPDTVSAEDALKELIKLNLKQTGKEKTIHYLEDLFSTLKKTNIGDNILFEIVQILKSYSNQHLMITFMGKKWIIHKLLFNLYKKLWTKYPESSLVDDSLFDSAEIYYKEGKLLKVEKTLKLFLKTYKTSWIFGEYNSHLMDEAQFLLASTYYEMGAVLLAMKEYKKLPELFPYSRLCDDSLKQYIKLAFDEKQYTKACKTIIRFKKKYKTSKFLKYILKLEKRCKNND